MKRVLLAGALSGLLILSVPTLASSAERRGSDDKHQSDNGHRDNDHNNGDRHDGGDSNRGYYGHRYGYGYGYGNGYYGDYSDCYHDPSGYTTCEPYGGDYDPGGYNGRYTYGNYDPHYCDRPHSAHSAQCRDDPAGANNGVPPGMVVIRDTAFNPSQINARVGEDVVWTFDDKGVAHTVTADNGSFDSGPRKSGEFHLRFDKIGTYSYHCSIHPSMKGAVLVGRES
jgi:plastocyanin